MTAQLQTPIYDALVHDLVRARHAADQRGLDPDGCVFWMTTSMLCAVREENPDHTVTGAFEFHGHHVRLLKGPDMIGFAAHPELV